MALPLSSDGSIFIEVKSGKMSCINIGHPWLPFPNTNLIYKIN